MQIARLVKTVQEEEGVQEVELEEPAVEAGHPAGRVTQGSRRAAEEGGEEDEGGNRKQRSILSELGSYPRGRGTGLARGEEDRVGGGGGLLEEEDL